MNKLPPEPIVIVRFTSGRGGGDVSKVITPSSPRSMKAPERRVVPAATNAPSTGTPASLGEDGVAPVPIARVAVHRASPDFPLPVSPRSSGSIPLPGSAASEGAMPASGRRKVDTVSDAFDRVTMLADLPHEPSGSALVGQDSGTSADLAAAQALFEQVAAVHLAYVRDVMLELKFGSAQTALVETTLPALHSVRTMAAQLEMIQLCDALDAFCVVAARWRATSADQADLIHRYERLIELIPEAFALDSERDRREPVIVEALLLQISGVERPVVEKLLTVGLSRLSVLLAASGPELAAVSGLRVPLATEIIEHLRAYRAANVALLSSPDPGAERHVLTSLVMTLAQQHEELARLSCAWSQLARTQRRTVRKQRELSYQRIRLVLARLGELALVGMLERQPYHDRITTLDGYIARQRGSP